MRTFDLLKAAVWIALIAISAAIWMAAGYGILHLCKVYG